MDPIIIDGVALVTGAGSGMGQTTANLLAQRGCTKMLIADISEAGLDKTKEIVAKSYPDAKLLLQKTDVSNEQSVAAMVKACVDTFGRLDFAINCAGVAAGSTLTTDMELSAFERLCNVNQKGIFLSEKHELTQMLRQEPLPIKNFSAERGVRGSIVNIASMASTSAVGGLGAYSSSKAGILGIAKVDARQFAPQKIRINCISPGFVDTPMMRGSGLSEEYLAAIKSQSPMNRCTHAIEIAETAVFLSSSMASGITGANVNVDAGANLFHVV